MTTNRLRFAARLLAPVLKHFGATEHVLSDINVWIDSEERAAQDKNVRRPRPMNLRSATGSGPPTVTTREGHTLVFVHVWADGEHDLAVEVLRKKSDSDTGRRRMFSVMSLLYPLGFSILPALHALSASDDGW